MLQDLSARLSKIAEQKRLQEKLKRDLHAVETELQINLLGSNRLALNWLRKKLM